VLPSPPGLCCGRPFYDFGRLDAAKRYLDHILDTVAPLLDDRTWLVGIEPSCLSVFRCELISMFPDDDRARRLSQRAVTLADFLKNHGHAPMRLGQDVAVHGHCHHRSVIGIDAELEILCATGRQASLMDDGCCGMAGAFGYEAKKYPVSEAIFDQGVRVHLAKVRADRIVTADGFSCRHQIAHFTARPTITFPELLQQMMEACQG